MTYSDIINSISAIVWGPYMIWLLVGTGVFITIRTGFIQFTKLGLVTRLMFSRFRKDDDSYGEGEISSVQALMTALSSTVGVGNIAGSKLIIPYRIVWVLCCVVGAISSLVPLWLTADLGLGLAILASLTCLLILSGDIARTTKEYFASPEYQELLKSLRK